MFICRGLDACNGLVTALALFRFVRTAVDVSYLKAVIFSVHLSYAREAGRSLSWDGSVFQ